MAYLFLPVPQNIRDKIYRNVVLNREVPQITTPYFKFYENLVHCKAGNKPFLEESIKDYYGKMLDTGATTLYEEFNPDMKGTEHYAMYGRPFEKSLCHAWSASPIYLLGRYRAGVENTGVAYNSFCVSPEIGGLKEFKSVVPLPNGYVSIEMDEKSLKVLSTAKGGILKINNKSYKLEINIPIELNL